MSRPCAPVAFAKSGLFYRPTNLCLNAVAFKLYCLPAVCNCSSRKIDLFLENKFGCNKTATDKGTENIIYCLCQSYVCHKLR